MARACRGTGATRMSDRLASIEIRDLYKIFGRSAAKHIDAIRGGLSKADLQRTYGQVLALNNISISIAAGKIQVVMGLSGSGKATLIRHINRLIEPTSGSILIDGRDVLAMGERELRDFRRNRTSMVFQRFALLPHRTVLENVAFGLEVRGVAAPKARDVGMRWIERVGLHGFDARYPHELSGGMQQRVGLARALSNDAPILLMDEAYSALDPLIRTDMQTMLLDLQAELKKTVVFITHDLDEALRLGDQIVVLRDGSIIQHGDGQDIVLNPADDYIRRFVKDVNRGRIVKVDRVMRPIPTNARDGLPQVRADATLDAAAKLLADGSSDEAIVVDAVDRPVGAISLRLIASALSAASVS
jgi:glycine betaine/proline transport system ATP-binding protein